MRTVSNGSLLRAWTVAARPEALDRRVGGRHGAYRASALEKGEEPERRLKIQRAGPRGLVLVAIQIEPPKSVES